MPIRSKIRTGGALAFCFVLLASPSLGAGPRVHQIGIDNLAFWSPLAGLHVGDIVEWTNSGILRHTATAADGSFDVVLPGRSYGPGEFEAGRWRNLHLPLSSRNERTAGSCFLIASEPGSAIIVRGCDRRRNST